MKKKTKKLNELSLLQREKKGRKGEELEPEELMGGPNPGPH
jgi:hypothetical protein